MLNASQLARTRGDGEICTKELPHSLAAFSSRNHAGEEGSLSPIHQSSCSRQRRFTTTPSRTSTPRGRIPPSPAPRGRPSCCKTRRGTGLPNKLFAVKRSEVWNGGASGQLRRLSGPAPANCGREKPERNLNKMEPPFWGFFILIWRCTPPGLHFPACTAGRAPGEELATGLLSFRRLSLDTGDEPDTGQRSRPESSRKA